MEITYVDILMRLGLAVLAGGVVGYEREASRHPAGLRTHILVCVGACTVALIECALASQLLEMASGGPVTMTMGRLSAQVISGIGFLGAGTILTTKRSIAGLTTAASVWSIACVGIAAGMGQYALAGICVGFILMVLTLIKRVLVFRYEKIVEISFQNRKETLEFLSDYLSEGRINVINVDFRVEERADGSNLYTNVYTLSIPRKTDSAAIIHDISEYPAVMKVRTRDV